MTITVLDNTAENLAVAQATPDSVFEINSRLNKIIVKTTNDLPPKQVPNEIYAYQGMLALENAGMTAAYEAWANDVGRTKEEKIRNDKSVKWLRNDPTLLSGASALGLTDQQIDDLFIAAENL